MPLEGRQVWRKSAPLFSTRRNDQFTGFPSLIIQKTQIRGMSALYDALDQRMLAHKEAPSPLYKGSQYEVNEDVMQAVYAPLFP